MRSEHDTTRTVRSWLEDGATALPDRVLDAVLDQLPATRQRRPFWPRLGLPEIRLPKFAATAAALVVALLLVVTVIPILGPGQLASPSPESSASSTPSLSPTPPPTPSATTVLITRTLQDFPVDVVFEAPVHWVVCDMTRLEQGVCDASGSAGVSFLIVDRVPIDPCNPAAGLVDLPPDPSVDDLVDAIANLPGFTTTTVEEITLDGFAGKEFTITAPLGATCDLRTWGNALRINGVGADERNLIRILNVDGTRVLIAGAYHQEHGPEDVAILEQIMDSVDFRP